MNKVWLKKWTWKSNLCLRLSLLGIGSVGGRGGQKASSRPQLLEPICWYKFSLCTANNAKERRLHSPSAPETCHNLKPASCISPIIPFASMLTWASVTRSQKVLLIPQSNNSTLSYLVLELWVEGGHVCLLGKTSQTAKHYTGVISSLPKQEEEIEGIRY